MSKGQYGNSQKAPFSTNFLLLKIHIDIDISKDTLDLHLLHDDILKPPLHRQLPNYTTGWQDIIALLSNHLVACVTLEATGGYERSIVLSLQKTNAPIVPNGLKVTKSNIASRPASMMPSWAIANTI